jgi:hypothetical protein
MSAARGTSGELQLPGDVCSTDFAIHQFVRFILTWLLAGVVAIGACSSSAADVRAEGRLRCCGLVLDASKATVRAWSSTATRRQGRRRRIRSERRLRRLVRRGDELAAIDSTIHLVLPAAVLSRLVVGMWSSARSGSSFAADPA